MAFVKSKTLAMAPITSYFSSFTSHDLVRSMKKDHAAFKFRDLTPNRIGHHIYSIWLFTFSDIKTIIAPSLAFAVLTVAASSSFAKSPVSNTATIISRAPVALLWIWINLLPFAISNQRQADAIAEDLVNKPWRTIPSKRMTPSQARTLMFCMFMAALWTSLHIGGLKQCLSLMLLGYWYNDLHGADNSSIIRNFINACGFNRFASGALEVLLGDNEGHMLTRKLMFWQFIIAAIVFTTVQVQDMYDQLGDDLRGRKTVPLVYGDAWARWSIAVPMLFWCALCPWYLNCPAAGFVISIGLGLLITSRSLLLRSVPQDKLTFKFWNLWMVTLYALPLISTL